MPADRKLNRTRLTIQVGATVLCILLVTFAALSWHKLSLAKSGGDLRSSYLAYHLGLLGKVKLQGCELTVKEPWMPQLKTYVSLEVSAPEVVFYDTTVKSATGDTPNFSVIRRPEAMSAAVFGDAEVINGISLKFVDRKFSAQKGLVVAWIEKDRVYVASESEATLRAGLNAIRLNCKKRCLIEQPIPHILRAQFGQYQWDGPLLT